MSIDQAGATVGPKTSTQTDSRAIKGRVSDAGDAPDGGFSLLLSAISPPVDSPAVEVSMVTPSPAVEPLAVIANVSMPLPEIETDVKDDVSLLAPAPSTIPTDLSSPIDIRIGGGASVGEDLIAAGKGLGAVDPAAGGADKFNRHVGPQYVASIKPLAGESLVAPADLTLQLGNPVQSDVASGPDPRAQKLQQARRALGDDLRADVTNARLESRSVKAAADLDFGVNDAMQAKLSLPGDFAARFLEPIVRPREKSFGSVGTSGAEAGWSQYAHHARTTADMPANFNTMVTTPAQAQVADKVSYWVSQGIQNAELTLDGFGADPVEVSILLKGGEAHVGFRSDQPEVRQMLEGALSQLKESLEREGVVLSGVTVGGSGAESGGRQQGQRRDSNAHRSVEVAQALSEASILRTPMSVGRSLDIFV